MIDRTRATKSPSGSVKGSKVRLVETYYVTMNRLITAGLFDEVHYWTEWIMLIRGIKSHHNNATVFRERSQVYKFASSGAQRYFNHFEILLTLSLLATKHFLCSIHSYTFAAPVTTLLHSLIANLLPEVCSRLISQVLHRSLGRFSTLFFPGAIIQI